MAGGYKSSTVDQESNGSISGDRYLIGDRYNVE
jgi:hypothetical protein